MASTGGGGFDEPARSTPVREWLLVLVVLAAGVVAVIGIYEAFQDASVRRTGAAAEGTLIGRSVGYRLPDRVRVAFATPDGHVVDRRFPVGNAQSYRYGTHVPVRYDPAHPSRAVLVHGQESRLVRPWSSGCSWAESASGAWWSLSVGDGPGRRCAGRARRDRPWRPWPPSSSH